MSMFVTKGEGVTTVTITANLRSLDAVTSQSVLGALQVMAGCLNIGLGAILADSSVIELHYATALDLFYPYVLGGVFIGIGIVCILTKKFPSPCVMFVNVLVNLAGVAAAITAIMFYVIYFPAADTYSLWSLCNFGDTTSAANKYDSYMTDCMRDCMKAKEAVIVLAQGVTAVLIIVSVLQLCVNVTSSVLGVRALRDGFVYCRKWYV